MEKYLELRKMLKKGFSPFIILLACVCALTNVHANLIIAHLCVPTNVRVTPTPAIIQAGSNTGIDYGENAPHIAFIKEDTVVVANGSTYFYTVDTPENQGLISTAAKAEQLPLELKSIDGSAQKYTITKSDGTVRLAGEILDGDKLMVTAADGETTKTYYMKVTPMALSGRLSLEQDEITANTVRELTLYFTAGQRSPDATVEISLPAGVEATMDNTTVDVIGRGEVKLSELAGQSIGRTGTDYSYSKVGEVSIKQSANSRSVLTFKHLDLRPLNRYDLKLTIRNVSLTARGESLFRSRYGTTEPEILTSAGTGNETAVLTSVKTISDFRRVQEISSYKESPESFTKVNFKWTSGENADLKMMQSTDGGKTWSVSSAAIDREKSTATISGLQPDKLYQFRLSVKKGENKGVSNTAYFYTGKIDIKNFGLADGNGDDTEAINKAIDSLYRLGGGTLLISPGAYNVRTVHLKSNVWLYVDKGATIKALKGADAPEPTWFSDKGYRSGTSPTDPGPYENPENWLTKQDVGHTFFQNTMFFAEREDNIRIIGNGRITGDGNLVTSDRVMDREPDNRADKMFTFKLCTNIEIGGLPRTEDLWYDPEKDEPYYIKNDGSKDFDIGNMLHIDQGGHFVLLATATDGINIHDTYLGKANGSNARDIYDFMECNNVTVTNIYSKVSSDDIVKLGSDCSLGFTRPVSNYKVRNIIGDTNCNLFQVGSETADDIMDVHVDNIYVLGANKAGFSISTNDGAHVKDIHLNCGHTGSIHSRSEMYRTRAPFFISISNRGRVIGANAGRYKFEENGVAHDELLIKNVNIGQVENIMLNGVDIYEVYGGSSYRDRETRWAPYDGKQNKATPIVAGYSLPAAEKVEGGLNFTLPDGRRSGYIQNIEFNDVSTLVKGGNPASDTSNIPPELGVGQYNVGDLKVQPSYGLWVRHVKGLKVRSCSFNYEQRDSRYPLFLDDVIGAWIQDVKLVKSKEIDSILGMTDSRDISIEGMTYYDDKWGNAPSQLSETYDRVEEAQITSGK